jgi:hypothetical protein
MHFHAGEIGHLEHLREQRTDIIEMREQALGTFVRFPAKHFLAVRSEPVEKIFFLGCGFLDEPRKPSFDRLQFSGMRFEIRMKTDEVCKSAYVWNVCRARECVDGLRSDFSPLTLTANKITPFRISVLQRFRSQYF